jgi:DNA polymerase-4
LGVKEKCIIHLDMDAFYASVEVLDNPELRGWPVIVGGIGLRGVVSAASYEAREFGVHSAQPIATARRLCPHGVYLPVRMSRYKEISDRIFEIFRRFTPLVEPLSLDEAFLDVTASRALFGSPPSIAREIRRLVREEVGLTVSAGVAPTKMAAKIASDLDKPDGLTIVPANKVREFLNPLPIGKLWGVGQATQKNMKLLGIETIGDLARLPEDLLHRKFGTYGRQLWGLARGGDDRSVNPQREVKSIGAEDTFPVDINGLTTVKAELLRLSIRVARRLRRHGFLSRTVTLKVKYSDFKQVTRAETLGWATDQAREVYQAVCGMLAETSAGSRSVRLLGISLSKLELASRQPEPTLLAEPESCTKGRGLERALDRISEKYGDRAVVPATLLDKVKK